MFHLVLRQLNSLGLNHTFSISDTQPFVTYGVHSFGLTDIVAHGMWGTASLVARFIHCGAHGIDLTSRMAQFIPISIPIDTLRDVNLPMPNISLVLSYPENPFLRRRFQSRLAAIQAAELFCTWIDYHVYWLAECFRRTILKGLVGLWNFAAVLGLTRATFLALVYAAGPEPPIAEGQDRVYDDTFACFALDLEVARFIRPWFTHFGVLEGPTQIGVALYPIEYPLAGPMDVVMDGGFEKMELDFMEMHAARGEL